MIFVGDWGWDLKPTGNPARILRLQDKNKNDNVQHAGETTVFSNGRCRVGRNTLLISRPTGMAVDQTGALYVADFALGMIFKLVDRTGDGDALDFAERTVPSPSCPGPRTRGRAPSSGAGWSRSARTRGAAPPP